jgi:hypothetical protein
MVKNKGYTCPFWQCNCNPWPTLVGIFGAKPTLQFVGGGPWTGALKVEIGDQESNRIACKL